jgi:prepilin-type processing-associated H-X9-DG protein
MGMARWKGGSGNPGPFRHGGRDLNVAWAPDRLVVLLTLGNANGGKEPKFWCAFDEDEDCK